MTPLLVFLCMLGTALAGHDLRIHNRCSQEIWVGLLGNSIPDSGGYSLGPGASRTSRVPNHWSGRVWGRTHCSGNQCLTGDCGRGVHCNGAGGAPPATLAEITFDAGSSSNQDFYDVSLVDGYNVQMSMTPVPGTHNRKRQANQYYCGRAGCNTDLNKQCPTELQVHGAGQVIACASACLKFNTDRYCCRNAYNTPDKCPPFSYSQIFKSACPAAYSYAYDDQLSTFTCNGHSAGQTAYDITFCG